MVTRLPHPFPAYAVYRLHPSYPNKGKVGVQRGRETAGVPSFLPPRRAPQRSRRPQTANPLAEVQRKTSRPLGANPPVAVRVPRSAGAEKEPPRQGEHADAVRVPQSAGAEKSCRPERANPPVAVRVPRSAGAEKEPPRQGEHADAVRVPQSAGAEKSCRPDRVNRLRGSSAPLSRCRIEKNPIFNRKNLRKPAWTDCLSHLYLL